MEYFNIGIDNKLFNSTFYYIIPYSFLTALGLRYKFMRKKQKMLLFFISLIIFTIMAAYYYVKTGSIQLPTIEKYPVRLYFLSYSVAMSYLLLMICENRDWNIYKIKVVRFISEHSLWIYLWHMLYLRLQPPIVS